jgi:DNA-binding transcriptional MerR regulator
MDPVSTDLVSIGEFARLSRLSPKALRLYDELGLLRPASVDLDSGYRRYSAAQVERARLVASLRQVGVPLAQIKVILSLGAAEAAEHIAAYWANAEAEHAGRRDLIGYLIGHLNGARSAMYEITVRDMPARSLLSRQQHASSAEVVALGKEFIARFRGVVPPALADPVSAPFVIYHGYVSEDSDGPFEWCWPVPTDQAAELATRFPDLTLRTEPAHEEAFVHLPSALGTSQAQSMAVVTSLLNWTTEHQRHASAGVRQIFIRVESSTPQTGPACDFAVPLTGADVSPWPAPAGSR